MPRFWLAVVGCVLAFATASAAIAQAPVDPTSARPGRAYAVFAGGCFWCMEGPFDKLDGVIATTSGYTGGSAVNPTYAQVSSGRTGHLEAVLIEYDPARVGYERLLEVFWRNIDPLDAAGQFCDRGSQYLSAIFLVDDRQRALAETSKATLEKSGKLAGPIVTRILPAVTFYPAEAYHQDYYLKKPFRYAFYRRGCGRDARLEKLWGATPGH